MSDMTPTPEERQQWMDDAPKLALQLRSAWNTADSAAQWLLCNSANTIEHLLELLSLREQEHQDEIANHCAGERWFSVLRTALKELRHTEEIRKAKEEAWDEGYMHGAYDQAYRSITHNVTPNPHLSSSLIPPRDTRRTGIGEKVLRPIATTTRPAPVPSTSRGSASKGRLR